MIAADRLARFAHRCPAELAAPDHDGRIEQSLRFQILDEGRARLIRFFAALFERFAEVDGATVVVPVGVIKLDESDAPFDQPARQQAIPGERGLADLGAVLRQRFLVLLRQVHEFRRGRLHLERGLVGGDPRGDLGVFHFRLTEFVEVAHGPHELPLLRITDAGGRLQIEDRRRPFQERHALVGARQEAIRIERRPTARTARAGLEHHEAGEVFRFAAEAVGEPRPHARPAELGRAGVDEALRRAVVEHVRFHAADPSHVVDDLFVVRQQFRKVHAAVAVLGELAIATQYRRRAFEKGEPLPFDERTRDRLPVELVQLGLRREEFELARPAGHEQEDDRLGGGFEVRRLRRERILALGPGVAVQQPGEGDGTEAQAAVVEEVSAVSHRRP